MSTIQMKCEGHNCFKEHTVKRDNDAPENATSMGCNWCPSCEDENAYGYWEEWYNFDDEGEDYGDDPNQLMLFSIADEVFKEKVLVTT